MTIFVHQWSLNPETLIINWQLILILVPHDLLIHQCSNKLWRLTIDYHYIINCQSIIIIAHRLSFLLLPPVTCQSHSSIRPSAQDRSTESRFGRKRVLLPNHPCDPHGDPVPGPVRSSRSQFAFPPSSQFTQFESWRIRVCRRRPAPEIRRGCWSVPVPVFWVNPEWRGRSWFWSGSEKGLGRLGTEEVPLVG
jgi:hypothetical protein